MAFSGMLTGWGEGILRELRDFLTIVTSYFVLIVILLFAPCRRLAFSESMLVE